MMTLRTLKKKSKQALPIMRAHYPHSLIGDVFLAEKGESYHEFVIRCTHGAGDPCAVEGRKRCDCTSHPLPGTPMIGAMSGYETPEWDEHTILHVLCECVVWSGRAPTMTDREWRRAMAITKSRPITDDEIRAWAAE